VKKEKKKLCLRKFHYFRYGFEIGEKGNLIIFENP